VSEHLEGEVLEALALGAGEAAPEVSRGAAQVAGAGASPLAAAAAHARDCLPCTGAIAALRREREAFARFADESDGPIAHLWSGIASRLPEGARPVPVRLAEEPPPAAAAALLPAADAAAHGVPGVAAALERGARPPLPRRRAFAALAGALAACAAAAALLFTLRPARVPALSTAAEEDDDLALTPSARSALAKAEGDYLLAARVLERELPSQRPAVVQARQALTSLDAPAGGRERLQRLHGYSAYLKTLRHEAEADGAR
jgi:hypothetical protein